MLHIEYQLKSAYFEIHIYLLQPLETSSKDSSQAVTIQKSPYRDQSLPSLDVKTNINNVNYQRNMSVLKKNVLSSRRKLSDSVCITMSKQQNDASENTCVSEPCRAAYEIPTNKTGFLTCNVDPATGCNVYQSLEDIPFQRKKRTATKRRHKALQKHCTMCSVQLSGIPKITNFHSFNLFIASIF